MSKNTAFRTIPLGDEFVCWDAGNRRVFLANETGALIVQWHCLGWSEQAIARELAQRYGLTTHEVAKDVSAQLLALETNILPIQNSEFGLINAGVLSARHRCDAGRRYRLWCSVSGRPNTEACLPDLYLLTEVAGFADQIARVFNLAVLQDVEAPLAAEPHQDLIHGGTSTRTLDKPFTRPERGMQCVSGDAVVVWPDADDPEVDEHAKDIVAGQVGDGYFIAVGGHLVAECDNLSSLLHHCVGVINTRWTVSQAHDVVLHAAAVSLGELVVVMPAASGSGKSTLATWLALRGCTFWGDDLIALTANARAIVPSLACASVKTGSRSVVFGEDVESDDSAANSGNLGHHGKITRTSGRLIENSLAQAGGWNERSIMLEQVRAPSNQLSSVPGCILFPQFDEQCKSIEVTELGSVETFRLMVSAGLALDFTSPSNGLEPLCQLLDSCKKIQVRYASCEDVWGYVITLDPRMG